MPNYFFSGVTLAMVFAVVSAAASAGNITVDDPYLRVSRPNAPTGAAFMSVVNAGDTSDRLLSASSNAAKRVELHTHQKVGDGIMKMMEIEDGIDIAAGEEHVLQRGGDHVMLMGLVAPLSQGDEITIVLEFEHAGKIEVIVPVDNERTPEHGAVGH